MIIITNTPEIIFATKSLIPSIETDNPMNKILNTSEKILAPTNENTSYKSVLKSLPRLLNTNSLFVTKANATEAALNEYKGQDFSKLKDTNAYRLQSVAVSNYSAVQVHKVFDSNKRVYLDLMNEFEKILFREDK